MVIFRSVNLLCIFHDTFISVDSTKELMAVKKLNAFLTFSLFLSPKIAASDKKRDQNTGMSVEFPIILTSAC